MAPTDSELVKRCLAGDIEAFGGLVARYSDAVYGLCYARLGNFEQARDLAQEAFVAAYRALGTLREPERFAAWLRRIAENRCKAERRRRRVPQEPWEGQPLAAPGDLPDEVGTRLEVEAALRSLPKSNREAISLFYVNGYTCAEIGRFLSLPASTVKGRLRDGRARLRKGLAAMLRDVFEEKALPPEFGGRIMQLVREVKLAKDDRESPVILLADERSQTLPVWIGEAEAAALAVALAGREMPRPMTYDLFLRALSAFGVRISRAGIAGVSEQTYMATVELTRGKQKQTLDARPSDAINLALRAKAPIYIADDAALAKAMIGKAEAKKRFPAAWKPPAARRVRVGEPQPADEPITRTIRRMLHEAVQEKADSIWIRRHERKADLVVLFIRGSQTREAMILPVYVTAPLRGRLAIMAGIELKPEARRQSGTIRMPIEGQKREFRVTFTPNGIRIKVEPEAK